MKIKKQPKIIIIRRQAVIIALIFFAGISLFRCTDFYYDYRWQEEMYVPGLKGKTVIIDPGHGGADPGAVADGLSEANVNMDLAKSLQRQLEQKGAKVKLTREGNQGLVPDDTMTYYERWVLLEDRKKFAQNERGHFLLSVHSNSHKDVSASGAIVFYADEMSKDLAERIQEKLVTLGPKQRNIELKNFTIINGNKMPSVLIEAGFLTNKYDQDLLLNQKDLVAAKILEGLEEYIKNLKPPE